MLSSCQASRVRWKPQRTWADKPGSVTPAPLVPADFAVTEGLRTELFVLAPLGPEHNEADYAAWTQSIQHIRQTPGFAGRTWPVDTVLDPASGDVIGCLYLYPPRREGYDVDVRSWVRADRAELDKPLYDLVRRWLADSWPFARPDYAAR